MTKQVQAFLVAVFFAFLCAAQSFAAVTWTETGGPFGTRAGNMIDFKVFQSDPNKMMVLWHNGSYVYSLLKSVDKGANWEETRLEDQFQVEVPDGEGGFFLDPCSIYGIRIDPKNFNKIYAFGGEGNYYGGVFVSDNGGDDWEQIYGNGVAGSITTDFEIALSNNKVLYRAMDPDTFRRASYAGSPMSVSTDEGNTWTEITSFEGLPPNFGVLDIDVHPTNESIVAVAASTFFKWNAYPATPYQGGVYISTSEGRGLALSVAVYPGYIKDPQGDDIDPVIFSVKFDRKNPGRLRAMRSGGTWKETWAQEDYFYVTPEVFTSLNCGATWTSLEAIEVEGYRYNNPPNAKFWMDPNDFDTIFFYQPLANKAIRSRNGGASWSVLSPTYVKDIQFVSGEANLGVVYFRRDLSPVLSRSFNWGDTFPDDLSGQIVSVKKSTFLKASPNINGCVFAESAGFWRTSNYGDTWIKLPTLTGGNGYDFDPSVAAGGAYRVSSLNVYQSTNNLWSWISTFELTDPLTAESFSLIKVSPKNPSTMFVAVRHSGGIELPTNRLLRSDNSGISFAVVGPSGEGTLPIVLSIDPLSPEVLYKGVKNLGIWRSMNSGESWTDITHAPSGYFTEMMTISAIAIDPKKPGTLYAGTGNYAFSGRVFYSDDYGASWDSAGNTPSGTYVKSLAINPVRTERVYAVFYPTDNSAADSQIMRKNISSTGWNSINSGISSLDKKAIGIDRKTDAILYAATSNGVYLGIDDDMPSPSLESVAPPYPINLISTNMTINGNYFINVSGVSVTGPQSAPQTKSLSFTPTYTTITAVLPPGLASGTYEIFVTTSAGKSNPGTFEVIAGSTSGPTIEAVKFDGRTYVGPLDPISSAPVVTARVRDVDGINPSGFEYGLKNVDTEDFRLSKTLEASSYTSAEWPAGTMEGTVMFLVDPNILPGRWHFTLVARDLATSELYATGNARGWVGTVEVDTSAPKVIGLVMSHPQPYKPVTGVGSEKTLTIAYNLTRDAGVTVFVYDISGRLVLTRKFASGVQGGHAGYNQFQWNGRTDLGNIVGNGIYVVKVVSGNKSLKSGKIVVLD